MIVYLAFIAVLSYIGVSPIFIFGIQYFFSDKLVLWTMGAKIVSEIEALQLHAMVDFTQWLISYLP